MVEPTPTPHPQAGDPIVPPRASARPSEIERRRQLVAESLQVGNPDGYVGELPDQADPTHDCQIEVGVDEIRPYDHNPRRADNAKYAEIKESIRAGGLRNPFTVTRRPGETHFIVEAGGNTRLQILRELWAETGDERFRRIKALFRPWRSESHVLAAHLIENDQRGDMRFWDKANGVVALKAQLEAEQDATLSLRQIEEALKRIGLPVSPARLSQYLFATERLATLGTAVADLAGLDVRILQPRLNVLKRLAQARASIDEDALYGEVFEPVFRKHARRHEETQGFGVTHLCLDLEAALAQRLGVPVKQLCRELEGVAQDSPIPVPGATVESANDSGEVERQVAASHKAGGAVCTANTSATAEDGSMGATSVCSANTPPSPERRTSEDHAASSAASPRAAILRRLTRQIERFSTLAGIGACWQIDATASHGYVMSALPEADDGHSDDKLRQHAWWLLAAASGHLAHASAADETGLGDETGYDNSGAAGSEPPAAPVLDAGFLDWLLDARDEAASAFWGVAVEVRKLRATAGIAPDNTPSKSQVNS